jgi:hypothetical protein
MNASPEGNLSDLRMHKPVILQYLIEVGDGSGFDDFIPVRETIVFKNLGTSEYNQSLGTVIPADATHVTVSRFGHQMEENTTLLEVNRSGKTLTWLDPEPLSPSQFSMYVVEYVVPSASEELHVYTKELKDEHVDFAVGELLIKILRSDEVKASFKGETGVLIRPDKTQIREEGTVYVWSPPRFEKLIVELRPDVGIEERGMQRSEEKKGESGRGSSWVFFVLVGLVVAVLVGYPLIKDRLRKR